MFWDVPLVWAQRMTISLWLWSPRRRAPLWRCTLQGSTQVHHSPEGSLKMAPFFVKTSKLVLNHSKHLKIDKIVSKHHSKCPESLCILMPWCKCMFAFRSAQLFAASSLQLAVARCGRGQASACSCLQQNLFRLAAPFRTTQYQGSRAWKCTNTASRLKKHLGYGMNLRWSPPDTTNQFCHILSPFSPPWRWS